jgi:rfaE bifunctional protein nucleotidyltransferase chain/domain
MARSTRNKVCPSVREVSMALAPLRGRGLRVVTTNGCFDILHAGHVHYLYEAAGMGDVLVVGVNCDAVVRRLKGPGRPVQGQDDRCRIVAALEMVDYAFVFEQDDPREFLDVLRPDVHVKGGDYAPGDVVETAVVERHGGVVRIVELLAGHSTRDIIARCGL